MKYARSATLLFAVLAAGSMPAEETQGASLWTTVIPCAQATGSASTQAQSVFPGADWAEATPESQQVDPAKLQVAVAYMDAHFGPDGADELVIIRNGYLIRKGPGSDACHNVWSCTKTFTSTVLGVLVAEGVCSLDDLAVKHLPEVDNRYPAYNRIRLRQLASMSSGYQGQVANVTTEQPWGEPISYLEPREPLFEPGTQVQYHDHQVFLLGCILTRLAGQSEQSVFKQRIADPIGMTGWDWGVSGQVEGIDLNNAAGTPTTPGIETTARQMARLGLLYLNHGQWDGRQLLPASFVDEATRNQVPRAGASSFLHGRYGFYWWTNDIKPDGKRPWPSAPPGTYTSHGRSANFCYVIPEWNMVVVRTGTHPVAAGTQGIRETEARWDTFFARLAESLTDLESGAPRTVTSHTCVSIRDGRWHLNEAPPCEPASSTSQRSQRNIVGLNAGGTQSALSLYVPRCGRRSAGLRCDATSDIEVHHRTGY